MVPPAGTDDADHAIADLGLTRTVSELLRRRAFSSANALRRFLEPRLLDLTNPEPMADRSAAVERMVWAVRRKQPICVFGDYDCDGITSTVILTEVLRTLGAEVQTQLASRFDGGYGVSAGAAQRILSSGTSLLVTCDCGSTDHESLNVLSQHGIDSVVIDHHVVPETPLPAVAFLNPRRPDCGFAFKHLASCGLVLSVAGALRSALGATLDLRNWLDLVAIGTVADVMPLLGDNRAMVKAGLRLLGEGSRPGLLALLAQARIPAGAPLTAEDVAFRIAPRLNAPGRLGRPDPALALLLERDPDQAQRRAEELEGYQRERRAQQDAMLEQAEADIEANGWQDEAAIVVARPDWNHGVVGIIAGRLADRYQRPVIVLGAQGDLFRGSVRGTSGFALHDLLQRIEDCLERFGGHQAAAGLDVRADRIEELRSRFVEACARCSSDASKPECGAQGMQALDSTDDPLQVARELMLLEPCGEGNPKPEFLVTGRVIDARNLRGGHLRVDLACCGSHSLRGFGPGLGPLAEQLVGEVTIQGRLRISHYGGQQTAELLVSRVQASREPSEAPGESRLVEAPCQNL